MPTRQSGCMWERGSHWIGKVLWSWSQTTVPSRESSCQSRNNGQLSWKKNYNNYKNLFVVHLSALAFYPFSLVSPHLPLHISLALSPTHFVVVVVSRRLLILKHRQNVQAHARKNIVCIEKRQWQCRRWKEEKLHWRWAPVLCDAKNIMEMFASEWWDENGLRVAGLTAWAIARWR